MDKLITGIYQHYKGDFYEVTNFARHTENSEELVIYKSVKDGKVWARPKSMFLEKIVLNGREVPRFRYLGR